jgi:bifunctional non-homologous end joining protein LigD
LPADDQRQAAKHDGFRFIYLRDGDRVRVFSRRGHDWTERVPAIAKAIRALPALSFGHVDCSETRPG